jgi:hypothetical protein
MPDLTDWLYRYRVTASALGAVIVLFVGSFALGLIGVQPSYAAEIAMGLATLYVGAALFIGLVSEALSFKRQR